MMQNVNILPMPSYLWLRRTRLTLLYQHSKRSSLQRLVHVRSVHISVGVQSPVLRPKLCDLCWKVPSVLEHRCYSVQSKDYGSDDEDIAGVSDADLDFDEDGNLSKDQLHRVRVNLYPDSSDLVIGQLKQAASVQDVFNIIEKHGKELTAEQSSQAIVTLWDLQKVYGRYGIDFPSLENVALVDFLETIVNHPTFNRLISCLETAAEDLESNAISCLLLYLFRLGLKDSSPIMQKLLLLSLERLDNFNLSALSRLSVYLRNQGLRAYYLQSKVVYILAAKLKNISTTEDLKLITICLNSTSRLLSENFYEEYQVTLRKFLKDGSLAQSEPKVILKALRFLNQKDWIKKPSALQREVMLCLLGKAHMLNGVEIIALNHYFQNITEPRELLYKIQERAKYLIEMSKSSSKRAKLMLCVAPFSSSKTRLHFEELIVEQLDEKNFFDLISVTFKCLRSIKTSNFKLCNAFWIKALRTVEDEIKKVDKGFFGIEEIMRRKVYQHYMYFNNNLGGTYRNFVLENKMSEVFLKDLRGQSGMLPHKVARMTSFLIGYNKGHGIPEDIFSKITDCAQQFSLLDVITLSRGIQITLAFNPSNVRRSYTEQITRLCHIMNNCTESYLKNFRALGEVCGLTRAYLNRQGSPRTFLFDSLVEAHLPFIEELNSRSVKDISTNFQRTQYVSPEILDNMAQYVIKNQEFILGDTMERFLNCLYILGYHPKNSEEFFSSCIDIFQGDRNNLQGLNILEMSIALCFYGHLRPHIIHDVFNINFLDKLDEEIGACYSKGSYPFRVRHTLMELNRAVCIDHPEEKIPWFHEKYCEERLEMVAVPNSPFHYEVHQALSQLVGGPEVVRANVKTPYFYLVDYEFLLDDDNRPVPVSEYASVSQTVGTSKNTRIENNLGYRRVAVLLRKEENYCVNSRQLLGRHQMECRHLEILGYTVVEVPHFMWYSMAHANREDRLRYLKKLIRF